NARSLDNIGWQLNAGLECFETIAQLFKRVQLHVGALAAIAIFVGNEVKALAGRLFFERVAHAAFGHHDEFFGALLPAPVDDGGSGADEIGHAEHISGALRMSSDEGSRMF